jgi:hypothetical protein
MTLNYSLSTDFNGNLYPHELFSLIESSSISKTLTSIDLNDDLVIIQFDSELSSQELSDLSGIISNYTYTPIINYRLETMKTSSLSIAQSFTDLGCPFIFDPLVMSGIGKINVLGLCNSGSYTIRCMDITNGLVLCSNTFSNTNNAICDLGSITNIPSTTSILEFHCKSNNSGNVVTIYRVIIYYY